MTITNLDITKSVINAHAHIDRSFICRFERNKQKYSSLSLHDKQSQIQHLHDKYYNINKLINRFIDSYLQTYNEHLPYLSKIYSFLDVDLSIRDKTIQTLKKVNEYKVSNPSLFLYANENVDIFGIPYYVNSIYNDKEYFYFLEIKDEYKNDPLIWGFGFLPDKDIAVTNYFDCLEKRSVVYFSKILEDFHDVAIHFHIDQSSHPFSKQTFYLYKALKAINYREKPIYLVHVLSPTFYEEVDFQKLLDYLEEYKDIIHIVVCPIATLSNEVQKDIKVPMRNLICRFKDFYDRGFSVHFGSDNVEDMFIPYNTYSMFTQAMVAFNAIRYYDDDMMKKILQNDLER